jgi:hypothetical protein
MNLMLDKQMFDNDGRGKLSVEIPACFMGCVMHNGRLRYAVAIFHRKLIEGKQYPAHDSDGDKYLITIPTIGLDGVNHLWQGLQRREDEFFEADIIGVADAITSN